MNTNLNDAVRGLAEWMEIIKNKIENEGGKFYLMGLAADVKQLTETLHAEVLERVRQEATLDVDVDTDYFVLAEQVLTMEMPVPGGAGEEVRVQVDLVNEALGALNGAMVEVDEQLNRRHKDEEYACLYEQENRRYMNSGTAKRAKSSFEDWKESLGADDITPEDVKDYCMGKLLKLFRKGVFDERVEQIQRAKRYTDEFDFDQLDDDNEMKKTAYRHYAVLRKLVDFKEGCLVVDPVKVGRHFYKSRKDANAKSHRTAFLKYMHKISLAQQEYRGLVEVRALDAHLPDSLATPQAMKYWRRLQACQFVDEEFRLCPEVSRKQAMYIADVFSELLNLPVKWKPFELLWNKSNLAQEKWSMQETGKPPTRADEIDELFRRA